MTKPASPWNHGETSKPLYVLRLTALALTSLTGHAPYSVSESSGTTPKTRAGIKYHRGEQHGRTPVDASQYCCSTDVGRCGSDPTRETRGGIMYHRTGQHEKTPIDAGQHHYSAEARRHPHRVRVWSALICVLIFSSPISFTTDIIQNCGHPNLKTVPCHSLVVSCLSLSMYFLHHCSDSGVGSSSSQPQVPSVVLGWLVLPGASGGQNRRGLLAPGGRTRPTDYFLEKVIALVRENVVMTHLDGSAKVSRSERGNSTVHTQGEQACFRLWQSIVLWYISHEEPEKALNRRSLERAA